MMSEDYFDDASDADFLALAHQIDHGSNADGNLSSRPSTTSSAPRPVPRDANATFSTHVRSQRPETPKTAQTTPKVLRPGFNSIIVNTRQVISKQFENG